MPATALPSLHADRTWPRRGPGRWTWAVAALLHVPLLLAMLHARIGVTVAAGPVAEVAVLPSAAPRVLASTPLPSPAAPRLQIPPAVLPFMAPVVPAPLSSRPSGVTTAIAAAPASAASAPPLILTLTPAQLRAIAGASGGGAAHGERASTLSALAPDGEMLHLKALPHGETEVHIHGSCYRLVPSMPSRFDPFNHANETLIAPCG